MKPPSKTILLVEDNDDDVFVFRRALIKAQIANLVEVVKDGQSAVDYLAGTGRFADRERYPLPFLVFLDLKLPYRSGFEVLSWIRHQPELESVVVVILTSSDEPCDHQRAYALGSRSYLLKPPSSDDILQLIKSMEAYWARYSEPALEFTHDAKEH